jgi:hypothetical protein
MSEIEGSSDIKSASIAGSQIPMTVEICFIIALISCHSFSHQNILIRSFSDCSVERSSVIFILRLFVARIAFSVFHVVTFHPPSTAILHTSLIASSSDFQRSFV